MKYIFSILTLSLILYSCQSFTEPSIERIENVKIEEFNANKVDGTADMVLHNANPFALDLASADMVAIVEEIEVATIKQTYDTKMPGNADFRMPIRLEMDLKKLYGKDPAMAISKGMEIFRKRELSVHFKGSIKVGKGAAKITVPVDQVEVVKF